MLMFQKSCKTGCVFEFWFQAKEPFCKMLLKYWVGVQQGQSYLMGKGASLALVGHPSKDGITIKLPSGVDFLFLW